jgi:hypothetical protein
VVNADLLIRVPGPVEGSGSSVGVGSMDGVCVASGSPLPGESSPSVAEDDHDHDGSRQH